MEGDGAWVAGEVLGGVGLVLRACAACDHFLILLPCGHGVSPSGEVWDACAAGGASPSWRGMFLWSLLPYGHGVSPYNQRTTDSFICPTGTTFHPPARFGTPARRAFSPPRRGAEGACSGLRPSSAPSALPPEHPLRRIFNFRWVARARVLCYGSFLHSLRSFR